MNDNIILTQGKIGETMVIFIQLPKDNYLIRQKINEKYTLRWNATNKMWYILAEKFQLYNFIKLINRAAWVDYNDLN